MSSATFCSSLHRLVFTVLFLPNSGRLFYLTNSGCSLLILLFPRVLCPALAVSWPCATAASMSAAPHFPVGVLAVVNSFVMFGCAAPRAPASPQLRPPQILLFDPFVVILHLFIAEPDRALAPASASLQLWDHRVRFLAFSSPANFPYF